MNAEDISRELQRAAARDVESVTICGHRFSPQEREVSLPDGSTVRFAHAGTGSNDIYDSYYRIAHREGTLEVYSGDHDVADYTEIRFNGKRVLYELTGPGTDEEEKNGDPAAPRWADALLKTLELPPGRMEFSRFCYAAFSAPGPTCARIYDALDEKDEAPVARPVAPLPSSMRIVEPVGSVTLTLRRGEVTCGQSGRTRNEVSTGGTWLSYAGKTISHDYEDHDHGTSESVSFDGATVWSTRHSVGGSSESTDPEAATAAVAWLEGLLGDAGTGRGPSGLGKLCARLHIPDAIAKRWARAYELGTTPTSGLAVAALVFGGLSVVSCGLLSPIGLLLSVLALRRTRRFAVTGLVLSLLGAGILALLIVDIANGPGEWVETRLRMERIIDEVEKRRAASDGSSPAQPEGSELVGEARDVWGAPFVYRKKGERAYEVRSPGPDGVLDNEDDIFDDGPLGDD